MIALDLDNTLLCYDDAFVAAARELGCLPDSGPLNKNTIKAAATDSGGNELWTRLQGLAYGEKIGLAKLFPGCVEFIAECREDLVIVSHKTRYPAIGPSTDLRQAALDRLASTPLANIPIHFHDTRAGKVEKIATLSPRALIDDLPEVLQTPGFPKTTAFVLFDPNHSHDHWKASPRISSWSEAGSILPLA